MKSNILKCSIVLSAFLGSTMAKAQNPIIQTNYTADPAPVVFDNDSTLYLYADHDEDGANWYFMNDWRIYTTKDMVNWTDHGSPLSLNTFKWAASDAWAAQCIKRNGKYYWYLAIVAKNGSNSIGVAVADSPLGPFKDAIGAPLCQGGYYIDPTVWIDNDGSAYLYWGNSGCWCCKLNEDMISYDKNFVIKGKHVTKVSDGIWRFVEDEYSFGGLGMIEKGKTKHSYKDIYVEGPWFYRRNNMYYLLYSAGGVPEHIAYSMSKKPTGPWKYMGQIMPLQNSGSFTNHCGVVDYKGHSYFFYHTGKLPGGSGFTRSIAVEEFKYNKDGTFPIINMTDEGVKPVGTLNPYQRNEAVTIAWSQGVKADSNDKTVYASDIKNGSFIKVRVVNFGDRKANEFKVSAASARMGGNIEVHLDSVHGPLVTTVNVPHTGGWEEWGTLSSQIAPENAPTGVRDVYFVFTGVKGAKLFNFDSWEFE